MANNQGNDSENGKSEIMTLSEIATHLKVSEKTILRMVQAGKLPATKVTRQWRFVRAAIDDWLNSRMYALPKKELIQVIDTAEHIIPITELVSAARIIMNIKPGAKVSILTQLFQPLLKTKMVDQHENYLSKVIERESLLSTAIGHGLAIPHVRAPEETSIVAPCIVMGICKNGAEFDALDGRKTYVFAMPCANTESSHLQLSAKISLIFRKSGIIKRMRDAQTKADVMAILSETDKEITAGR
jgi:PTS system nitrogen regulatory IIA component